MIDISLQQSRHIVATVHLPMVALHYIDKTPSIIIVSISRV
jgi:hypothetical protein